MSSGLRPELEVYLERLRMQAYDARDFSGIPKWLTNHTTDPKDPSRPWTFHEHEYQPEILADTTEDVSMQKCSQVGASATARKAKASSAVSPPPRCSVTAST